MITYFFFGREHGFSLIELAIVIVVIGILAAITMQSMTALIEDSRRVKTEREMELLANAIVGNPSLTNNGIRSDFGYVGDIGAFPPNLQALYQNPGGYTTWDGPYIDVGFTQDSTGFKTDDWGQPYSYSGGITITSTGSGSTITKKIADATSDYLFNTLNGTIKDASDSVPGLTYRDSVDIEITIPDGSGSTVTKTYRPDSAGAFTLDSLPAGTHPLRIIYTPDVDTLFRYLTILPRHKSSRTYKFASGYFGGGGSPSGGLEYVAGSAQTQTGQCNRIEFDVINNSASSITVTSMTITWSSPTAYYEKIKFDGGAHVFNQKNPRAGSGDIASFSSSKVVNTGNTATIRVEKFTDVQSGGGNSVDMSNTSLTITFSDGSTINFNTGTCQ